MQKVVTQFSCTECGTLSPRWVGQCHACQSWNSFVEETVSKSLSKSLTKQRQSIDSNEPIPLDSVEVGTNERIQTGITELDLVLGGGFVCGSAVLLGGEPGIGKSTLGLQVAQKIAALGKRVVYISAEETLEQVYFRSNRLGKNTDNLFVLSESKLNKILISVEKFKPDFVILDSIQMIYHDDIPSTAGSVNQVRHCANELVQLVKKFNSSLVLIGHITKEGGLAGPKVLEHLVDVILYMDGERSQKYRLLRCYKNRFSSTQEIGVFEMKTDGLVPIDNPHQLFVDDINLAKPGTVISAVMEGSRAILVEIQALVVRSGYGMAKRTFLGVDANRANLMLATMEKSLGIHLGQKDVILNIVGGFKIKEPTLDLGLVMAIVSSDQDCLVPRNLGIIGEVGITGELRVIPDADRRVVEFEKMGFLFCVLPAANRNLGESRGNMKLLYAANIREAIPFVFGKQFDFKPNTKSD